MVSNLELWVKFIFYLFSVCYHIDKTPISYNWIHHGMWKVRAERSQASPHAICVLLNRFIENNHQDPSALAANDIDVQRTRLKTTHGEWSFQFARSQQFKQVGGNVILTTQLVSGMWISVVGFRRMVAAWYPALFLLECLLIRHAILIFSYPRFKKGILPFPADEIVRNKYDKKRRSEKLYFKPPSICTFINIRKYSLCSCWPRMNWKVNNWYTFWVFPGKADRRWYCANLL